MINRVHNFSAGPCTLPLEVLEEAREEFVNYQESGMSLIEMSHRGKHFDAVHNEAIQLAREVFEVPEDFCILFLQGGATLQFSMVPMNLLGDKCKAAYIDSGSWGSAAIADARIYGSVYTAWDGNEYNYSRMPSLDEIHIKTNTRYLHITSNETIGGIRFVEWPDVNVPVVADMSSDYMSRRIPWQLFDVVYGGVQKNLGPAGMAVVFVRQSILSACNKNLGRYLRYDLQLDSNSMLNTPPVFPIYLLGKVLRWMRLGGGIEAMERAAEEKAALLYSAIDNSSGYFSSPVDEHDRSVMNVVFRLPTPDLENLFLGEANGAGFVNLKGHRSVGGCRASIYNAMPRSSVALLVDFMKSFQLSNPA